jgi:hypothetical protein
MRTDSLVIASLAHQIVFLVMDFTIVLKAYHAILLIIGRWRNIKYRLFYKLFVFELQFFYIFNDVDHAYVFWNLISYTPSYYCLRLAMGANKDFAIKFSLKFISYAFFAIWMSAFRDHSRDSIILVKLWSAQRTNRKAWFYSTVLHCLLIKNDF